jgi:hypothetical protein
MGLGLISLAQVLPAAEFSYSLGTVPAPAHPDTTPPSLLCDGLYTNVQKDSVQFNNHLKLSVDLKMEQTVRRVTLHAFQLQNQYVVGDYELLSSMDSQMSESVEQVTLTVDKTFEARYLMLKIHKAPGIVRMMLGELVVDCGAPPTVG